MCFYRKEEVACKQMEPLLEKQNKEKQDYVDDRVIWWELF